MEATHLLLGAQNLLAGTLAGVMRVTRRRMVMEAMQAHGEDRALLPHTAQPPTVSQRRQVGGTDEVE
jgi:hypothetical protein